jgi:hypothetical protein
MTLCETEPLSMFAKRLGVSLPKARALVRTGHIPIVDIPGPPRVPKHLGDRLLRGEHIRGEVLDARPDQPSGGEAPTATKPLVDDVFREAAAQ